MEELSLSLACVLFSGRLFLLGQGVGLDVGFFAISFEEGWVLLATRVLELAQVGGSLLCPWLVCCAQDEVIFAKVLELG